MYIILILHQKNKKNKNKIAIDTTLRTHNKKQKEPNKIAIEITLRTPKKNKKNNIILKLLSQK